MDSSEISSNDIFSDLDITETKDRLTALDIGGMFSDHFLLSTSSRMIFASRYRFLRIGEKLC